MRIWPEWKLLGGLLVYWVIPSGVRLSPGSLVLRLYVLVLELDLRSLVSDKRRLNRIVVWHLHWILHLLVENWHVLVVLVCLRVLNLHGRHLNPALALRRSYLVEIRLLLRLGLIVWVGEGLSGS